MRSTCCMLCFHGPPHRCKRCVAGTHLDIQALPRLEVHYVDVLRAQCLSQSASLHITEHEHVLKPVLHKQQQTGTRNLVQGRTKSYCVIWGSSLRKAKTSPGTGSTGWSATAPCTGAGASAPEPCSRALLVRQKAS